MARVPYVDLFGTDSPELATLGSTILGLGRVIHNLHMALANQPAALRAFMDMSQYIRNESSIPPPLRELTILATAYALDSPYEIHYHSLLGQRVGLSADKMAAFPNWADSNAFDATELAVLSFADQVARRRAVDDATFEELRLRLSVPEVIDLGLLVGWYHLCAAFLGALEIEVGPRDS